MRVLAKEEGILHPTIYHMILHSGLGDGNLEAVKNSCLIWVSMSRPTGLIHDAEHGNHPEIRRQMIALIRKRRRKATFTRQRPTDIRPREFRNPETEYPLSRQGMWAEVARLLETGVPLRKVALQRPAGEVAWHFVAELWPGQPALYVKLQILGSTIRLRSFHPSEVNR